MTLGTTHNNPFNVSLPFPGSSAFGGSIVGAPGQSGYGSFPDLQTGFNAGVTRLNQYISNGYNGSGPLNTIGSLGPVYAADPNWAASVSRISGIPLNETLDPNNAAQMSALQQGIITQEQGAGPATSIFNQIGGASPADPSSLTGSDGPFDPSTGFFDYGSNVGSGAPGTFAGTLPAGISSQGSGNFLDFGASTQPAGGIASGDGGDSVSVASGNQAPFSSDITNFSVAGVNAPPASGVSTAAAPQGTAPTAQGGTGSNAGAPLDITNAQQIGDQAAGTIASGATTAANTLSKSVTGAGQAVQSAEGNFAAAGTSWLGSIFSAGTSLFVRGGFVALGLVLILGAFVFFYAENREGGGAIA